MAVAAQRQYGSSAPRHVFMRYAAHKSTHVRVLGEEVRAAEAAMREAS